MTDLEYKIIEAAGGNPTGIVVFPDSSRRAEYPKIALKAMSKDPRIEQFGFLEGTDSFYMSGGEFSGNATRAAAWLISGITKQKKGEFGTSGLQNKVKYEIFSDNIVRCDFPGLFLTTTPAALKNGIKGKLIDFGGIVHFVLDPITTFPNENAEYMTTLREVVKDLRLEKYPAVGCIWQEQNQSAIKIYPVVWVKDINSYFLETSCGSGTLAALEASGENSLKVEQISGQTIDAAKTKTSYSLVSEVKEI